MAATQLTFLASLDFPDGSILRLSQIASKLDCTVQHLLNEIDAGTLCCVDLKSAKATRRTARVSVEMYRDYVTRKCTGRMDALMGFLDSLPVMTRVELISFLQASLKGRKSA